MRRPNPRRCHISSVAPSCYSETYRNGQRSGAMWRRRGTTGTAPTGGGELPDGDLAIVLRAMVDRRAFAPLYEKYVTAIYRRCRARLRDADEAWDATGVTFHKALAALEGFQGG